MKVISLESATTLTAIVPLDQAKKYHIGKEVVYGGKVYMIINMTVSADKEFLFVAREMK